MIDGLTHERFRQGLTMREYLDQMTMNRERFDAALRAVTLTEADHALLRRLGAPRHVLVITEDWCGTSLAYVPVVAKLAEAHSELELRVFLRDASPDVMDRYLKRGLYKSIPVIVFFDAEMNELARFIEERPA